MTKLIIHIGTGTIIDADECVIVDVEKLDDHDTALVNDGDDSDVVEIAGRLGKPLNLTDLSFRNTVAFSPSSLRSEAEEALSQGFATDDDDIAYLTWTAEVATDEELSSVADYILNDDTMWNEYNTTVMDGMRQGYRWSKENKKLDSDEA
jgi:hypothetical protein